MTANKPHLSVTGALEHTDLNNNKTKLICCYVRLYYTHPTTYKPLADNSHQNICDFNNLEFDQISIAAQIKRNLWPNNY